MLDASAEFLHEVSENVMAHERPMRECSKILKLLEKAPRDEHGDLLINGNLLQSMTKLSTMSTELQSPVNFNEFVDMEENAARELSMIISPEHYIALTHYLNGRVAEEGKAMMHVLSMAMSTVF